MKKPTSVTFHTKTTQPVPANRLPEAPPPRMVWYRRRRMVGSRPGGRRGSVVGIGRGGGGRSGGIGLDRGVGGGGHTGARVEAALEVEAETSFRVLHLRGFN